MIAAIPGLAPSIARALSADVVVSQVYGGGGNAGSTYRNDFIELHNRSAAPVSLAGWSVQYASAAGTSWTVTALSGSIAAGGYYLVQEAAGTSAIRRSRTWWDTVPRIATKRHRRGRSTT